MVYALTIDENVFQPAKFANIGTIINVILPLLTLGAALIFLVMALLGGFKWITSGGSQENLAKAQKIFTSSIIGLVIVIFAFVLVKIIGYVLQIQILP